MERMHAGGWRSLRVTMKRVCHTEGGGVLSVGSSVSCVLEMDCPRPDAGHVTRKVTHWRSCAQGCAVLWTWIHWISRLIGAWSCYTVPP